MLIENDDMIQTFTADRTDDAFDVGVLPRRARRSNDLLLMPMVQMQSRKTCPYDRSRSRNKSFRGAVSGKAWLFDVRASLGSDLGDIEVNDPLAVVAEDDHGVEQPKRRGRDDEHVDGDGVAHVIS